MLKHGKCYMQDFTRKVKFINIVVRNIPKK